MDLLVFSCTLVLAGAIVYASNDRAGAFLLALGVVLAGVRFAGRWWKWWK